MPDAPPYRKLPWSEVDLLLHPGRFLSQDEARDEIARIRDILDERRFPQDFALISRTATALDRKAVEILRWTKPTEAIMNAASTVLLGAAITTFIRGHLDWGGVGSAAICFALCLAVGVARYAWPAVWADVAEEYRRLAIDLRRAAEKIAPTEIPVAEAETGVRVDPGGAGAEDAPLTAPEPRVRKAGEP